MAIKIINENEKVNPRIIKMSDMKPLQVGRVVSDGRHKGKIVMRTQSSSTFEVLDFSGEENSHWNSMSANAFEVELLPPGEKITLEISNEK